MIKKIIFLAVFSITITSCSTYNGFGKRKYYDFSNKSALSIDKNKNAETDKIIFDEKTENKFEHTSLNEPVVFPTQTSSAPNNSNEVISAINKQTKNKNSSTSKVNSKSESRIFEVIKKNQPQKASSEHKPGSLWWIWAIAAFVGFMLALFVSALFGFLIMSIALVFVVVCLILLFKSK